MPRILATDIISLTQCPRRFWYERNPPAGVEEAESDPFEDLISAMGLEHERAVRDRLAEQNDVVEASSPAETHDLMAARVPVIYQAHLIDEEEQLVGKPDFLLLQDDGAYQAADAKFARSVKKEIGVQVAFYRRVLGTPHPGLVFLGTGDTAEVGPEHDPHLSEFLISARTVLGDDMRPEVHFSASKCGVCPFNPICYPEFVDREALSLLYGVDRRSVPSLEAAGITTISELAESDHETLPDVPYLKGAKKERAVLQAQSWKTGAIIKRSDIEMPVGTWVHFDIEANPLTTDGEAHVYLWGFLRPPYAEADFEYVWTDNDADDRAGWMAFVELVERYRSDWPDLRLVHFSSYERSTIKAYANRYDMEGHPTVGWLLDKDTGPLYDIQTAVTDSLVLPLPGYGLKAICKHVDLVNFQWADDESGSQWSVVQYINFLRTEDPAEKVALKTAILGYNRDDVTATRKLEEWLRSL